MRTFQQQRNYEKLEQLPPQYRDRFRIFVWQICDQYLDFWGAVTEEPQVRQNIDPAGKVYWETYDPQHHCKVCFDDEQKLLVWLDQKPYRNTALNPWEID